MGKPLKRWFTLGDLIAVILLCGVSVGILVSGASGNPSQPVSSYFMLPVAWGTIFGVWSVVRSMRSGPMCQQCGRRFAPVQPKGSVIPCPYCGDEQPGLARRLRRSRILFWLLSPLIAVFFVVALAFASNPAPVGPGERLVPAVIAGVALLLVCASMVWLVMGRLRLKRTVGCTCEACGGAIPAKRPVPTICPSCTVRQVSLDQAETDHAKSFRLLIVFCTACLMLVALFVVGVLDRVGLASGPFIYLVVPLVIGFLGWKMAKFVINVRKVTNLLSARGTLAAARECAGEVGTETQREELTIWYSGPIDPGPLLREEFDAARRRVARVLGIEHITAPVIRVVGFEDREALRKFFRKVFGQSGPVDELGGYFQRPWKLMVLCTSEVRGRLSDPRTMARSVYTLALIEEAIGQLPGHWIQAGLSVPSRDEDAQADRIGLNRQMLAALSHGIAWSEELFTVSGGAIGKLLKRPDDLEARRRVEQFGRQSLSVLEYLCGSEAPEVRKSAFRAFVNDLRARTRPEEVFFEHFGFGFGSLYDAWREWVLSQGRGPDIAASPERRAVVVDRILPVIEDTEAALGERLQAIRDWRAAGVLVGVETMIELLREPGAIPREEIVWSLRVVSGVDCGVEAERWREWWMELAVA